MCECVCKFCGNKYTTLRGTKFHEIYCKLNPDKKEKDIPWNKGLTKETNEKIKEVSEKLTVLPKIETRICKKCGKEFQINVRKSRTNYCSLSCRNSHVVSNETKQNISKGLLRYNESIGKIRNPDILKKKPKLNSNEKKIVSKKYCLTCGSIQGECPRPDICKHYQILKSLVKFGFNLETKGSLEIINEFDRIKNILQEIYNSHPSEDELRTKWNYTSGLANLHKILKSVGIKTKTNSESQRELILLGKKPLHECNSNMYKTCWYKTWNNKEVFLRSSYEYDYAQYLDENKIDYDVEGLKIEYFDTQKNIKRVAIPDFYLIKTNEIVEIKSNWTLDVQNMKDKFDKYIELGYKPKLILEHKEVDLYSL